jgi:hypothetical protein
MFNVVFGVIMLDYGIDILDELFPRQINESWMGKYVY